MSNEMNKLITRRDLFIGIGATLGIGVAMVGALTYKGVLINQALLYGFPEEVAASGLTLPATLCDPDDHEEETIAAGEGPFYSPKTPLRSKISDDRYPGTPLILMGRVLDTNCKPIAGAVLDFWQADPSGNYDNDSFDYRYRGHQFTDADGIYRLETTHPVEYTLQGIWRTAHLHVKVQGPNTDLLTTQLFWPREAENNANDLGFRAELLVEAQEREDGTVEAFFNFVLPQKA